MLGAGDGCNCFAPEAYGEVLDSWMQAKGSRDLKNLLKPLGHQSLKTVPNLELLVMFVDLCCLIFKLISNTLAHHSALVIAVLERHVSSPCLFSPKVLSLEAGWVARTIRIGAAKYRTLAEDARALQVVPRKAAY